jgi:hypothetical protein
MYNAIITYSSFSCKLFSVIFSKELWLQSQWAQTHFLVYGLQTQMWKLSMADVSSERCHLLWLVLTFVPAVSTEVHYKIYVVHILRWLQ